MNIRSFFILIFGFCLFASIRASHQPEFSTAGFFRISNSGRDVYNTNPAWRLHKGYIEGGTYVLNFDDSNWEVTSLPDGIGTSPAFPLEFIASKESAYGGCFPIFRYDKREG